MDDLVIALVKLIFLLIRGIFRLIIGGVRALYRLGDAEVQRRKAGGTTRALPKRQAKAAAPPPPKHTKRVAQSTTDALRKRVAFSLERTRALSATAAELPATYRFVPTLDALIERELALDSVIRRGENDGGRAARELDRDDLLFEVVSVMVRERADGGLTDLLADTDALAASSYAPIVEYCGRRGIPLSSDRAATVVDGDKLFFLSVDDPTGLACIVLPRVFAGEIVWWPAIAHEIAHDFYNSVAGLPAELARALSLTADTRVVGATPDRGAFLRALATVPDRAVTAWREELFADAFGTMMLGPAYVLTMSTLFAAPEQPARALAIAIDGRSGAPRYEEHPPGHVRVVAACRLLARMGYGAEADRLQAAWRKRHGEPDSIYVPIGDDRYVTLPEEPILARAAGVGEALYLKGLPCLRGQPLRSIPGLDFGPREHEQARRVSERLMKGRPPEITDPRLLVAGAVLARLAQPARAAEVYAIARQAMGALAPEEEAPLGDDLDLADPSSVREALILDAVLRPSPVRARVDRVTVMACRRS